jgi:hypothetical protein
MAEDLPREGEADQDGAAGDDRRTDVATRLLRQALDHCWCAPEELADALGVARLDLTRFGSRQARMTATQRARLAERLERCAPAEHQMLVRAVRDAADDELSRHHSSLARRRSWLWREEPPA